MQTIKFGNMTGLDLGAATPFQRFLDMPDLISLCRGCQTGAVWFATSDRESATIGGNIVMHHSGDRIPRY